MAVELMQAFMETDLPPAERLTGIVLANHHNGQTGQCNPSLIRLARMTGLHRTSVIRAIKNLERGGHISVERRFGGGSNYILHPVPAKPEAADEDPKNDLNQSHHATGSAMRPVAPCDLTSRTTLPPPVAPCDLTGSTTLPETEGNINGNRREPERVARSAPAPPPASGGKASGTHRDSPTESTNENPKAPPPDDPDKVELDGDFPDEVQSLWGEWKAYRAERAKAKGRNHHPWTHRAAVMSAKSVERAVAEYGPERAAAQMESAISGNWKGLNFDKMHPAKSYGSDRGSSAHARPPAKPSRPPESEPPSWRSEWARLKPDIPVPATWAEARPYRDWLAESSDTVRRELAAIETGKEAA